MAHREACHRTNRSKQLPAEPEERSPSGPGAPSGTVPPDIRLAGVSKSFGDVTAVDSIDLEIARGEFFTLLGPSGSGKTTTLMMLAGFEVPTHGEIYLADRPIKNMPPHKRDIGICLLYTSPSPRD